nr:4'-phosphopantetheinyl transferase superfamily protein [Acinetobacter sp. Marseille-Q1620]
MKKILSLDQYITFLNIQNDGFMIQHEVIILLGIRIHKVFIKLLHEKYNLEWLYQKLGIVKPASIKETSQKRKLEYLSGRLAAKFALEMYEQHGFEIEQGQFGQPIWPKGMIGSISHTREERQCVAIACTLQQSRSYQAVGVDIEFKGNNAVFQLENRSVADVFLSPIEQNYLSKFNNKYNIIFLIVFSSKESLIKTICSRYQLVIDFKCIQCIDVDVVNNIIKLQVNNLNLYKKISVVNVHFFILENELITICNI